MIEGACTSPLFCSLKVLTEAGRVVVSSRILRVGRRSGLKCRAEGRTLIRPFLF